MLKFVKRSSLLLLFSLPAWAINTPSTGYRSDSGTPTYVYTNSVCRTVINTSGKSYFVPTKTLTEWNAFTTNLPTGVTVVDSCPSCNAFKKSDPTFADGIYSIDVDGAGAEASFPVYCDMTTTGGGWTLVWSNTRGGTGKPTTNLSYSDSINSKPRCSQANTASTLDATGNCSYISTNLEAFNYFVGLKYWDLITESKATRNIMYKWANDYGSPIDQQFRGTLADFDAVYTLNISGYVQDIGSVQAQMAVYHNGRALTAIDNDADEYGTNCSALYSGTPWWYGSCWSGSINGGGETSGSGYYNGAYWNSSNSYWGTDTGNGAGNGWIFIKD